MVPTGREPARDLRYRRVLLKLSGEALMGDAGYGIDTGSCSASPTRSATSASSACELALVIGGGNIFRGVARRRPRAWTAPPPTTWACWPR